MHLPVGRSVIALPAAKAATCQILGHSESRLACVVSTYIIRRGRGLRRPVVRSGDAARRPAPRPRLTPFPAAEWISARASPALRRDGFAIGDSNPNYGLRMRRRDVSWNTSTWSRHSRPKGIAENGIAVAQQVARELGKGKCFTYKVAVPSIPRLGERSH